MVPTAAQSIRVEVLQDATVVNTALLTVASPSTTFAQVPTGTMTVKATAFPNADGTGTAMALAQTSQTIADNTTASVSLTMGSTIDHLTVTPNPVNFLLAALFPRTITVTAYDAGNNVVLTAPGDIGYASSNFAIATVSASGTVAGLALGQCTITATDAVSGKSGTTTAKIL